MRWKEPKSNDQRIIKKFLLSPKTIKGETRFLEIAYITQEYLLGCFGYFWKDIEWSTKENYNKYMNKKGI